MCLFPFHFWPFTGVLQEIPREVTRKYGNNRGFETRSFPDSLAATHRGFTFYVADPISSIHE